MGKNAAASMAAKASQLTPGGRQALVSAMGGTFTSRGDRSFILKNILGLDLDTELNGGSEKSRKLKAEAARAIANGELISPEARVYEKYAQSFSSLGSVSPENRNVSGGKVEPSAKLFELIEASYKQAEKNMMTYADAIVHLTGITNTLTKTLSKLQGNMGTLDRLSAASGVTGVKGYRD